MSKKYENDSVLAGIYAKKQALAAQLQGDPENKQLQFRLNNLNSEIARLELERKLARSKGYELLNKEEELEL